jgi:hypothetical protein
MVLPRFIFGMPADVSAARTQAWVPTGIKQSVLKMLLRMLQGPYSCYGLPENVGPPLGHHPTLNSDLLDFNRHGRINPRPAIKQLLGNKVEFVNGEREPFDVICVRTGFWTTFPFFDNPSSTSSASPKCRSTAR